MPNDKSSSVPIINIQPLLINDSNEHDKRQVANEIHKACREWGFFYVENHQVSRELQENLFKLSREFFQQPTEAKMKISMANGGRAWRGYFPVGNELTSGKPDGKEGIYFGTEITDENHPKIRDKIPLHGKNQFPIVGNVEDDFRCTVLEYMAAIENLGRVIMSGIAQSLGLKSDFFNEKYLKDEPTCLFRIFNYPSWFCQQEGNENLWGVGEHTDYGMLTILLQDECGGLQVKTNQGEWIEAPPIDNTFVCNIGDMLDRMTGGYYRSTPHRVRNQSTTQDRLSFPFFLDPDWDAEILPIPTGNVEQIEDDAHMRWDKASVHTFQGTYGEYLLKKVSQVFPDLAQSELNS